MCRPATCASCGNATWKGCGMHVDQVMAGIPARDRCSCDGEKPPARDRGTASRLGRLFGR